MAWNSHTSRGRYTSVSTKGAEFSQQERPLCVQEKDERYTLTSRHHESTTAVTALEQEPEWACELLQDLSPGLEKEKNPEVLFSLAVRCLISSFPPPPYKETLLHVLIYVLCVEKASLDGVWIGC